MAALDQLLEVLETDYNRLQFLLKLYTPGNTDVADRILGLGGDYAVLNTEIEYSRDNLHTERYDLLMRRKIDYLVRNSLELLIGKELEIFDAGSDLVSYAIERLTSTDEATPTYKTSHQPTSLFDRVMQAADIAESFGLPEQRKELLEQGFTLAKEDSVSRPYILQQLGKYDEAVLAYLAQNHFSQALTTARDHAPEKLEFAARYIKNVRNTENRITNVLLAECEEILGNRQGAISILEELINPPGIYSAGEFAQESVLKLLLRLGETDRARNLVDNLAAYDDTYVTVPQLQERVARFYELVCDTQKAADTYLRIIDEGIERGINPTSQGLRKLISKGVELTGRTEFHERMITLHLMSGEYTEASKLAGKLGKDELAVAYAAMQLMVANPQFSQQPL